MSVHACQSAAMKFGLCVGTVWANFDGVDGYLAVNWFVDKHATLRFMSRAMVFCSSACSAPSSRALAAAVPCSEGRGAVFQSAPSSLAWKSWPLPYRRCTCWNASTWAWSTSTTRAT
jgi:hypothetical protein